MITTSVTQIADTDVAIGKSAPITSVRINAKDKIEAPHRIYPPQIKAFLFPTLSEKAPTSIVVKVADIALADTMNEISDADALNIL
jgi:hypothetical protein